MVAGRMTNEEIALIRKLHQMYPDWSCSRLARLTKSTSATVSYWLRRTELRTPRKAPFVQQKSQKRRRILVVKLAKMKKPSGHKLYASARSIVTQLKRQYGIATTKPTVCRDLNAEGMGSRVRPKVTVSPIDYPRRLAFCKQYIRMTKKESHKLVFSDEKIFCTNDYSQRSEWVMDGETAMPRLRQRWPQGRVHVWGAIGIKWKLLVVLPETQKVEDEKPAPYRLTAQKYVRKCLAAAANHLIANKILYQQDGAGCHRGAKKYLRSKGIRFIEDWPARSPDLSPIENLWEDMQTRVSTIHAPRSRTELIAAIKVEWEKITNATLEKYIESFPKRCRRVVELGGAMCQ